MTQFNFKTRSIAIVDLETTGLNFKAHEIIEMGIIIVTQPSLEIIDTYETKIKPLNIQNASPEALKLNGYNAEEWKDSISLQEALQVFIQKTQECMFCAHNVIFDWSFIQEGLEKHNLKAKLDYHFLDTATMVWLKLSNTQLERINLNKTAEFLGIDPEPDQHRALNGAMTCYKILKKLKQG